MKNVSSTYRIESSNLDQPAQATGGTDISTNVTRTDRPDSICHSYDLQPPSPIAHSPTKYPPPLPLRPTAAPLPSQERAATTSTSDCEGETLSPPSQACSASPTSAFRKSIFSPLKSLFNLSSRNQAHDNIKSPSPLDIKPVVTSNSITGKMEAADRPESPPLPKSTYSINWDEVDETTNPFGKNIKSIGNEAFKKPAAVDNLQNNDKENNPLSSLNAQDFDSKNNLIENNISIAEAKEDICEEPKDVSMLDLEANSTPLKTVTKPSSDAPISSSPPLSKSSYSINWDEVDETTNPFGPNAISSIKKTLPADDGSANDNKENDPMPANSLQNNMANQAEPMDWSFSKESDKIVTDTESVPTIKKPVINKPVHKFKKPPPIKKNIDAEIEILLPPTKFDVPEVDLKENMGNEQLILQVDTVNAGTVVNSHNNSDGEVYSDALSHHAASTTKEEVPLANIDTQLGEEFRPASEVFNCTTNWDLLNTGPAGDQTAACTKTDLSRQSLYVKFDPFVDAAGQQENKNSSDATSVVQTTESETLLLGISVDEVEVTKISGKNVSSGEEIFVKDVDALLMTSPEAASNYGVPSATFNSADRAVSMNYQASLLSKDKECGTLKKIVQALLKEQIGSRKTSQECKQLIKLMTKNHSSASQASLNKVIKEKEEAVCELQTLEQTYILLHNRFEVLSKHVVSQQELEMVLRRNINDLQENNEIIGKKYQELKENMASMVTKANDDMESTIQKTNGEIAKVEASLRMAEMKLKSSENLVEQKNREIVELSSICDELLAKVNQTNSI